MFEITRLKHAITAEHHCRAEHTSSKLIVERRADGTIWRGKVEIFDLPDHPPAQRCYAWTEKVSGLTGWSTVVRIAPVTSTEGGAGRIGETFRSRAEADRRGGRLGSAWRRASVPPPGRSAMKRIEVVH